MKTIVLPLPPSTNNLFANGRGRYRTQEYDAWIEHAIYELGRQKIRDVIIGAYELNIKVPMKMRGDVSNRIKAPEDLLVKQGFLPDDKHAFKVTIERNANVPPGECHVTARSIKTGAA
jgi:Holliday junction resolvase RusA-like endonuclease